MPIFSFALEDYAAFIRDNPEDFDGIYRKIVHEVPRFLMAVEPARRAAILEAAPLLTGTRFSPAWRSIWRGSTAWRRRPGAPAWCDEPGRFVDPPWVVIAAVGSRSVVRAPAAFLRHGALPDPMDLDARGGEPEPW